MKTLGDYIKNFRLEKNLSMDDFSSISGLSKAYISVLERDKHPNTGKKVTPTIETVYAVAKAIGIDANVILNNIGEQLIRINANNSNIDLDDIPGITVLDKVVKIPILGEIACGNPIWAEENFEGFFAIDPKLIKHADFCLQAKGDSMIDAEIYDGDTVFLKKTPVVENGKIAAVLIEDSATLKKVYKTDMGLILQPCNDNYEPYVVDKNSSVMILGEMTGVYHPAKN